MAPTMAPPRFRNLIISWFESPYSVFFVFLSQLTAQFFGEFFSLCRTCSKRFNFRVGVVCRCYFTVPPAKYVFAIIPVSSFHFPDKVPRRTFVSFDARDDKYMSMQEWLRCLSKCCTWRSCYSFIIFITVLMMLIRR